MSAMATEVREELGECPYCDAKGGVCKASVTSLKIGALVRLMHCNRENYNTCAFYLNTCVT